MNGSRDGYGRSCSKIEWNEHSRSTPKHLRAARNDHLTRRAKHRHNGIIENFVTPAREDIRCGHFHAHSRSDGGRASRPRTR